MKYLIQFSILLFVFCFNIQLIRSDGVFSFDISLINNKNKGNLENICQNNRTKCTDKQTCCKTDDHNYHCCKYPNAVCCPDMNHCCPADTTCDIENKKCINSSVILSTYKHNKEIEQLQLIIPTEIEIHNFSLPENNLGKGCLNEKYRCPGQKRCCELYNGNFGCCVFNHGVCCPDLRTCCPHQTDCDVKNKKCTANLKELNPISVKVQEKSKRLGTVVCPDNVTECFSWETCCPIDNKSYGCCPFVNATCCADKSSCCRQNEKCDTNNGRCLKLVKSKIERNENETNRKLLISFPDILKLNHRSTNKYCPSSHTLCRFDNIQNHCCPYTNAVCCPDMIHCCPTDTTCDIENKKCINSSVILSTYKHNKEIEQLQLITPKEIEIYNFSLPENNLGKGCLNEKYRCPGQKRCCELYNGNFGCCAFNHGVCCPDLRTCCPHQTDCDVKNKKCTANTSVLSPISVKVHENSKRLGTVVCPDNVTECFSWETCCPIDNKSYGCCPFVNATCCADKSSCCRQNEKCDTNNGRCLKLVKSKIERNENETNRKLLISFPDILKSNHRSTNKYCPSSHTLCRFDNIQNHCCPYTNGVCCSDLQTCCPEGTRCVKNGCE